MKLPIEPHMLAWNLDDSFGEQLRMITPLGMFVHYPKYSISPGRVSSIHPLGGTQFFAKPEVLPTESATLSYSVTFAPNFAPAKGGKLPGMYVSVPEVRPKNASGGRRDIVNCSIRLMWRAGFACEAYVYPPTSVKQDPSYYKLPNSAFKKTFGDSLWRGLFRLEPNDKNHISLTIELNTPGKANGVIKLTVNDVTQVFDKFVFRKSPKIKISNIFFSTFFGGSDRSWQSPTDTSALFSDFELTES